MAFLGAGGILIERTLAAGKTLTVDTGCLGGFLGTCDHVIRFQRDVKDLVFGGEGPFLTEVTGSGNLIIWTQPISELALVLKRLMPVDQWQGRSKYTRRIVVKIEARH